MLCNKCIGRFSQDICTECRGVIELHDLINVPGAMAPLFRVVEFEHRVVLSEKSGSREEVLVPRYAVEVLRKAKGTGLRKGMGAADTGQGYLIQALISGGMKRQDIIEATYRLAGADAAHVMLLEAAKEDLDAILEGNATWLAIRALVKGRASK